MWQSWRDYADGINVPYQLTFELMKRKIMLGGLDSIRWAKKGTVLFLKLEIWSKWDIFLLSLKEKKNCHVVERSTWEGMAGGLKEMRWPPADIQEENGDFSFTTSSKTEFCQRPHELERWPQAPNKIAAPCPFDFRLVRRWT